MAGRIAARLAELNITLPAPAAPAGSYQPTVQSGTLIYVSGQVPFRDGRMALTGKLGDTVSLEQGRDAAHLCTVNVLAQLHQATGGDLDRISQIVRIGGFVAATPDFTDHPKVLDAASDLLLAIFGEAGRSTRYAVGVTALPFDAPVEIETVAEVTR